MAEQPQEITREAQEWFISIFGVDGPQPDREARSKHRIPKAPAKFREFEEDKKYFDPRVVSLGPYHHGKDDNFKPMEKHKITAAKQFLDESGRGIFYEKVKELTRGLKEFYDAEVVANMSDVVFARMMFLDGCFVLHFIEKINGGEITKLEISNDLIPLIIRDMFLIENQLPFEVLDALMKLRWGSSSKGKEKILEFINLEVLMSMGMYYPVHSSRSSKWCKEDNNSPLHLLNVLRTILLDSATREEIDSYIPGAGCFRGRERRFENRLRRNFGSVVELEETMIRIEKGNMKSLMDISYKENLLFPQLLLPTMFINDTTISQLLNLTAYEACFDTYPKWGVTSYIQFMDSLINDKTDVKMLRSKGILHHSLDSDNKLARLFNQWPADVTNDHKKYRHIRMQILRHRNSTAKISIATWVDKYFGSPWSTMSIVGAGILLIFTAIQTYCAAFSGR